MRAVASSSSASVDRKLAAILSADVVGYSRLIGGHCSALREADAAEEILEAGVGAEGVDSWLD